MENQFINREESLMNFNQRILLEAKNKKNPLGERLNFLEIADSNFNEFFRVRVGKIMNRARTHPMKRENKTNLIPEEELKLIHKKSADYIVQRNRTYKKIEKELRKFGINIVKNISEKEAKSLETYYNTYISPNLHRSTEKIGGSNAKITAPFFKNGLTYVMTYNNESECSFIEIDYSKVDRVIQLTKKKFILTERLVSYMETFKDKSDNIFTVIFKMHRNTDYDILHMKRYNIKHFDKIVEKAVNKRAFLDPVKVEYKIDYFSSTASVEAITNLQSLITNLATKDQAFSTYVVNKEDVKKLMKNIFMKSSLYGVQNKKLVLYNDGIIDIGFLDYIKKILINKENMFYPEMENKKKISSDNLLVYPFNSMDSVLNRLEGYILQEHDKIKTIYMSIYRVNKDSRLISLLKEAVNRGAQVTAVIELCARFDEAHNLEVAKELQSAGIHVVYGYKEMKVHAKMLYCECIYSKWALVSTGNFNEVTSKFYTDVVFITEDPEVCEEIYLLFNIITMNSTLKDVEFNHLLVSPKQLKNKVLEYIKKETEKGENGFIFLKMNALTDKKIINALLEADKASVKVFLCIRGVCCLKDTENIKVRSIVGRYLEHSRIYVFGDKAYISSADFMNRNTDRRVEVAIEVSDPDARKKLDKIIYTYINNTYRYYDQNNNIINTGAMSIFEIINDTLNFESTLMNDY